MTAQEAPVDEAALVRTLGKNTWTMVQWQRLITATPEKMDSLARQMKIKPFFLSKTSIESQKLTEVKS